MHSNSGADSTVINILHITDCHLTKEADGELLGINTRDSLDAVLHQIDDDGFSPDYVMATGDLAQDASPQAYHHFKSRMTRFPCPISWFPGNHDDRINMRSVVADGPELDKVVRLGNWQFVLLDSLVSGKVHGCLDSSELETLEHALAERPDLHTIVCLHHHPVDIDSVWLDKIGLHNRDELLEIIDRHDSVRALLWGHIHQEVDELRKGVRLLASPSTCIQFLPKSEKFAVEDIAPGYRWLKLYADGRIETRVVRAESFEFKVNMQSNGY